MSELEQYDFDLPPELIAQQPTARRTDARLMVVDRAAGTIDHRHVRDLPELLRAGDCLVMNDSRVIPARIVGYRELTGGHWEGLFLEDDSRQPDGQGAWKILSKTRGKIQPGETVVLQNRQMRDSARLRLVTKLDGGQWIAKPVPDEPAIPLLERIGRVPLPPYIRHGAMTEEDRLAYQTVYAAEPGSVAAPTAGLHFTPELLTKIEKEGVVTARVTLHVGLGTFRPIEAERLSDHVMHSEWCRVSEPDAEKIRATKARGGRVIAVGTTAVRTLESAAAQTASNNSPLAAWQGRTELFIKPGYQFRVIDGLMTNFHLPRSSLLVLVRTFGGDELLQRAYREAIAEQYRFFSYGDAMLVV